MVWQLFHLQKGKAMAKHSSLTWDRVADACKRRQTSLDNPGFCVACGHEQEGCEPDAREYECEACGENKVYGSDELALEMLDCIHE